MIAPAKIFTILLVSLLANTVGAQASGDQPLKNFTIEVTNVGDGVRLKGKKGTAWRETAVILRPYQPATIDYYGVSIGDETASEETDGSPVVILLHKTAEGLTLKGLKGTAWGSLNFSLAEGNTIVFDQFGMKD